MASPMGHQPHLMLRTYGATSTNNTATARTGVSITHIELEGHQNSSGAITTKNTVILLLIAVKAMVHPHPQKERAKATRELKANETGRARISQRGTDLIKPHLHYTTSPHLNHHLNPRGGTKASSVRRASKTLMWPTQ